MPTQHPIAYQNLLQSLRRVRSARKHSRLTAIAITFCSGLATITPVLAQGGGNANAIGISVQNSANAAAATQNSAAMGFGPADSSLSPPGMSSEEPGFESGAPSTGGAGYSAEMGSAEMGSAEMYRGEGPGGYGSPGPGGRPGQLTVQGLMMSASSAYLGNIAEFLNRPLSPDAVKFQPTLAEQAALAFHYGDQRKAIALFQAHLVTQRESAANGLDEIRYNALARRPTWAIRIGVSLHARVADALIDDPQPIRADDVATTPNNRVAGNPYGGPGRGRTGRMAGGPGEMEMSEPGMAAMPAVSPLGMPGGEMSADGMMTADGMMDSEGMMGVAGGGQAKAAPVVNPAIAAAAAAEQKLDSHLGMITELVKSQLTSRFNAGKFGSVLPGLAAKGAAVAEKAEQTGLAFSSGPTGSILMWTPGVDFVGTGDVSSMIAKCRENEIDILLHFDVIVKENRGEPQYDARCRLINCAAGENISVSKAINKREVLISARTRGNAAVIADLMQPVFDGLDAKVVATPLPPLQPQHAVARIDMLLAKPDVARPDHLAELAMFHHKRLIDDNQFEQVMFFAAGENGLKLIFGSHEERAELAATLVQQQLGSE